MFSRALFCRFMKLLEDLWNTYGDRENLSKKRFFVQSIFYNIYAIFWLGLCIYGYIVWHKITTTSQILLDVLIVITAPTDISSFWSYDKWKKFARSIAGLNT